MGNGWGRSWVALVLGVGAVAAVASAVAWPYTVDDAFVVARHAAHLAGGSGYAMNAGVSSDGVTGPLWVGPMVAAAWARVDPIVAAKLLGGLLTWTTVGWAVLRPHPDIVLLHTDVEPQIDADGRLVALTGFEVERRIARSAWLRDRYRVVRIVPYSPHYWYVVATRGCDRRWWLATTRRDPAPDRAAHPARGPRVDDYAPVRARPRVPLRGRLATRAVCRPDHTRYRVHRPPPWITPATRIGG